MRAAVGGPTVDSLGAEASECLPTHLGGPSQQNLDDGFKVLPASSKFNTSRAFRTSRCSATGTHERGCGARNGGREASHREERASVSKQAALGECYAGVGPGQ